MAPGKIRDFGDQLYRLEREKADADGHFVLEHEALMAALRGQAKSQDKAAKQKAVQALRYAKRRLEGLVNWKFTTTGVEPKSLITWAERKVQPYFRKQ
jgi:hypothetical protein